MSEEKVTRAKFEMNRQTGNLILARHAVSNPIHCAGMLLESEVEQVADRGVVHAHIETLIGRPDQAKLADIGLDRFRGVEDSPVAFPVVEAWIDLFTIQCADPKPFGVQRRFRRG